MNKKLAVFDWNGTLFDDTEANLIGANACLKAFGVEPIDLDRYRDSFDFPVIHLYQRNGVSPDEFLSSPDKSSKLFVDVYEEAALKCGLREGTIDLLEWLKENNFSIIILTNHLTTNVQRQLERFNIWYYFDHLSGNISNESVISKMNKEKRMREYLEKNNINPEDAFIIGDSFEEPEIARHIGMKSINILGGCISEKRLKKAKADAIISNLSEVKEILKEFWG